MKRNRAQVTLMRTSGYFVAWCALMIATASVVIHVHGNRRQHLADATLQGQYRAMLDVSIPDISARLIRCAADTRAQRLLAEERSSTTGVLSLRGVSRGSAHRQSGGQGSAHSGITLGRIDDFPDVPAGRTSIPLSQVVCPAIATQAGSQALFPNTASQLPGHFLPTLYGKYSGAQDAYVRVTFRAGTSQQAASNALRSYARQQSIPDGSGGVTENPALVLETSETSILLHVYLERSP